MQDDRIKPGTKVRLKDWDTRPPEEGDAFKREARERLESLVGRLAELQHLLYAQRRHRVLVVLQGMDTSGKDGTIKAVFSGVSPSGLRVVSFKAPTQPELERDFLWRVHREVPADGELVVFNRSHYEDVLAVRVRGLRPEEVWRRRYRHIAEFERLLAEEGTLVLKFFLHISKATQKKRLEERLAQKDKNWKWDPSDLRDRESWDAFQGAYEEALERTASDHAPWFVVPSDKKWWRDLSVARSLVEALEGLKMRYPTPKMDVQTIRIGD